VSFQENPEALKPEHGGEDFLRDFQLAESMPTRKASKEFYR
jgi:hypothetical protein